MSEKRHLVKSFVPFTFEYNYRLGAWMEKYVDGLAAKKIFGVKCTKCGRVIVPPRSVCGICNVKLTQWVEVGTEGELRNYTVGYVAIDAGEVKKSKEPYVIGMVKLDGADSLVTGIVKGVKPDELKAGIRLRAVFAEEPKGTLKNLSHFEPLK